LVASAISIVSAQTGGISVKVVDSNGDPLPAATVTISHPTGYVKEAAVLTNAKGLAVFPVLRATGTSTVGYTINIVFPGFAPMQLTDVKVSMGETTRQPVQLAEEIVERVKVVAKTDVVDLENTSQTTKFSEEFIDDLPVPGRFYQNVLTLAPGVQDADGDGNPNVHGSRNRDFKAEVGGISNVDPLTGQRMNQVNPNSIEEIEVVTAGAGVEFSRAQGGFARILQKQGSNEFEGQVDFIYRSSILDGSGADNTDKINEPDFDWIQPGFQFSGPIVKDKLWYRLSHQWINRGIPVNTTNGISVVTDDEQIHADQLTWQISPRNKLALQYQWGGREITNFGVSSTLPEESSQSRTWDPVNYMATWTAPFSPKILIETQLAWQDLPTFIGPSQAGIQNRCLSGPAWAENANCFDLTTGEVSGSSNFERYDHRQRMTLKSSATIYGGRWLGASHQLKLGLAVENERYTRDLERRPSLNFTILDPSDDTNTEGDSGDRVGVLFGTFTAPQESSLTAKGIAWGIYAEDQIKPAQNLTVTLGLRVDREEIRNDGKSVFNPEGESAQYQSLVTSGLPEQYAAQSTFTKYEAQRDFFANLADAIDQDFDTVYQQQSQMAQESEFWWQTRAVENLTIVNTNTSPRIAVSWDPWSNGKTKFAATAGRYYQAIPLAVPLLELEPPTANIAFNMEETGFGWNFSGIRNSINPSVNIQSVDRNLSSPYQDELTLQFERQLWAETSLKLTYVNRQYNSQLQDYDLNHVPGDLGKCILASASSPLATVVPVQPGDPAYDPQYAPGDGIMDDCIGKLATVPAPGEGASDEEIVLDLPDGRADLYLQNPGWGDIYLVSNINQIDYEAVVFELIRRQYRNWQMQASYTWSQAFGNGEDFQQNLGDDRSLVEDEQGYQSYDQRHVVKVNATTITPWGFRMGGSVSWQSGLPYSVVLRTPAFDAIPPTYGTLDGRGGVRIRSLYPSGTRNDQRNESYWDVNVNFIKEFTFGRNLNMQLSVEIFNLLNDDTYQVYNPALELGEQINGTNVAVRRFGREWQIGMKFAF
jgi:hypothetical protein